MREAAKKEFVTVIGTLGILDRLYAYGHISEAEYDECLNEIKKHNGVEIRLPSSEIEQRLSADFKPYIKGALNLKV